MIEKRTGPGNDFLGWLRYPETYDKEEKKLGIKEFGIAVLMIIGMIAVASVLVLFVLT